MKNQKQFESIDFMQCIDWSSKHEEKSMLDQEGPSVEPPLNISGGKKKTSYKNKYVKKLKESCAGLSTAGRQRETGTENQVGIENNVQKKVKNKLAAKESRDRKKIYIKIIEKQTRLLQQQLNKVNKQLDENKAQIIKMSFASSHNIQFSFTSKINHVIKKLKKLISQNQSEQKNNEINLSIDSLCYRFAAMGKERRTNINDGYKQILILGVPAVQKYLIWAARQNHHIFADQQNINPQVEAWFDEMRPILQSSLEKNPLTKYYQAQINVLSKHLLCTVIRLIQKKQSMESLCFELDQLFQDVRNILTPDQLAKFLLFQEGMRYKEELRYYQKICQPDNVQDMLREPRKLRKLDDN